MNAAEIERLLEIANKFRADLGMELITIEQLQAKYKWSVEGGRWLSAGAH